MFDYICSTSESQNLWLARETIAGTHGNLYTVGMKLAVDIGGTKTLLAVFDDTNHLIAEHRFPTPQDYKEFLNALEQNLHKVKKSTFTHCVVAVPGVLDRVKGTVVACGNLPWQNEPIQRDTSRIIGVQTIIENDAKLAGLYEAQNVKHEHDKILYVTISTGIGTGVIANGVIDPDFQDMEGGHIILEHDDKEMRWEDFASGSAIKEKYGKLASDITDEKAWKDIAHNIAVGLMNNIALVRPDIVIIGGGVGQHFPKFKKPLQAELEEFNSPLTPVPPIVEAKHAEEAVIYGCLTLMNQS